jgi:kynurenine formamidase
VDNDSTSSHFLWLRQLASQQPFGPRDRLGTLNLIDQEARRRAVKAVVRGDPVSLARAMDDEVSCIVDASITEIMGAHERRFGLDHVHLECHGRSQTHVDALSHVSFDGTWYSGWAVDQLDTPSVADWSGGAFTRAVHVNVNLVRGTEWAAAQDPVEGSDIDAALSAMGISFQAGDALLLDMGRDRFEESGGELISQLQATDDFMQPGVGATGAEWIADNRVSVLCWDFFDAVHPSVPRFSVHPLIWAIGLVIVDNCTFARLRAVAETHGSVEGALVLGPLPIPGGTGSIINPLVLL